MIKVLIVEDEVQSSNYLKKSLDEFIEFDIVNIINSVSKAIQWLNKNQHPDLIFMDVQLSDGDSFEIFDKIKIKSSVIFLSAYNEYAYKAIKSSGIDYLLKPISKLDLAKALIKFLSKQIHKIKSIDIIEDSETDNDYKKRLLLKEGNYLIPVKTEEIAYIYWSQYAFIKRFDGKTFIINYSLSQIEDILPSHLFIRVNRQIIANINSIVSLSISDKNSYLVKLLPTYHEDIKLGKESYLKLKKALS